MKKSLHLHRYIEVSIGSLVRLSFPSNLSKKSMQNILNLYTPYTRIMRCLYPFLKVMLSLRIYPPNIKLKSAPSRLMDGWNWIKWIHKIEKTINEKKLQAAFLFPYQKKRKKAACLLLSREGKPILFAKLAWSNSTKEEVANEANALDAIRSIGFESFQTPEVVASGNDGHVLWNLYTLLPFNLEKQKPRRWDARTNQALLNKAWLEMKIKTKHNVITNKILWLEELAMQYPLWRKATSLLKEKEPKGGYSFCMAHGDMAPWNMLHFKDELWLYDWENFSISAPLQTDPICFYLKTTMLLKKHSPQKAIEAFYNLHKDGAKPKISDLLLTLAFFQTKRELFNNDDIDEMAKTVLSYET